jgi:hypothetical protein
MLLTRLPAYGGGFLLTFEGRIKFLWCRVFIVTDKYCLPPVHIPERVTAGSDK